MTMRLLKTLILTLLTVAFITACSSDDSEGDYPESYFQFVNVQPNTGTVYGYLDDDYIDAASYGDASSMIATDDGSYTFELKYYNSNSELESLITDTVQLSNNDKSMIFLQGDYDSPTLLQYQYQREDLEDEFRITTVKLLDDDSSVSLHLAKSIQDITDAVLVSAVEYQSFNRSELFEEDEYTLYLIDDNSGEVIFYSNDTELDISTDYVAAIIENTGPSDSPYSIALISNSSTVVNIVDATPVGQIRVYNSLNEHPDTSLSLSDNVPNEFAQLSADTVTDFVQLDSQDYEIKLTDNLTDQVIVDEQLLSLNSNDVGTLLFYQNEDTKRALFVEETLQNSEVEFEISIVNLYPDLESVDVYFVYGNETIDTTKFSSEFIDFTEAQTITILDDEYKVYVVYKDDTDESQILARIEALQLNEAGNYMLVIEPDEQDEIKVNLVH